MHSKIHLHKLSKAEKERDTEIALLVVSSIGPISSIPQIIKIWSTQSAGDFSLLTWSLYMLSSAAWFAYGVKLRNRPLIINNIMWASVYISVIVGILKFS